MSNFAYVAFDAHGQQTKGVLDVADQNEAVQRLKEMGYFPTKIVRKAMAAARNNSNSKPLTHRRFFSLTLLPRRIDGSTLCVFTRQLATLIEAGMPLLRGLHILAEQERNAYLKWIINDIANTIESGGPLSEGLAHHPKVFNRLYINMVKAGEIGGVLEVVLKRLADFMEKALRIKGKIKAAMFYPVAVITVAVVILGILMVFVVPRFKEIFSGLLGGVPLPAFTAFVLGVSEAVKNHFLASIGALIFLGIGFQLFIRTKSGRKFFDRVKLSVPGIGIVIRKAAIARFARTFGTLVSSGVPILQTLTIVKETSGNELVCDAIARVHESVKEGETIAAPLKSSGVFPSLVVGMIDIGEQTGALPEMLLKVADNYDDEVDNAVASMTSLLEPIMIVFLAVVVGSIVIALFLPLIQIINIGFGTDNGMDR